MEHQLTIYNTLDRKKELFVPLHAPHVGMYVSGPVGLSFVKLGKLFGLGQIDIVDMLPAKLEDRKSTRLNSSHASKSRMPSSA